jgi:hypothetical protein
VSFESYGEQLVAARRGAEGQFVFQLVRQGLVFAGDGVVLVENMKNSYDGGATNFRRRMFAT